MLKTFNLRAPDLESDAGYAEVTIVATGMMSARTYLTKLLKYKGRMDLVAKFQITSTTTYFEGVVHDNVETRSPEDILRFTDEESLQ